MKNNLVLDKSAPGIFFTTPYFLVTCESVQKARVLHYIELERLEIDKHSSLLGVLES
jgi:hypothetical protein